MYFLGKEEIVGSNPTLGSRGRFMQNYLVVWKVEEHGEVINEGVELVYCGSAEQAKKLVRKAVKHNNNYTDYCTIRICEVVPTKLAAHGPGIPQ